MRGSANPGLALVCLAVLWAAPAMAQKVGTAAAVNPASTGAPPGGGVRTLSLGADVVHNERIHTDARGSVQLLFVDRTSMSIGPNSDITIDEYVFDPNANTGKLAVTVGKGLLRFVGGQVSHSGEATVTTPSASIGIRGGTGIIEVDGAHTRTINLFGHQNVNVGGTLISLYRPNFMLDIQGGTIPGSAVLAPPGVIAALNVAFQAKPGQTGGSAGHVTQRAVQAVANTYNVTGPITSSSNPVQAPTTSVKTATTDPAWPTFFLNSQAAQTTLLAAQQGQQNTAAVTTAVTVEQQQQQQQQQQQPQQPQTPPLKSGPFLMNMSNCCVPNNQTSAAPYLPVSIAFAANPVVSPVLGFGNAPAGSQTNNGSAGETLQFGFNLTGTQGSQQSWFFVAAGNVTNGAPGSQPQLNGLFFGTSRATTTQPTSFAVGGFNSTTMTLDSSGAPTSLSVSQSPQALAVSNLSTPSLYTFTQTATGTTSVGPGFTAPTANRPAVTLAGYAGGLIQTLDATGHLSAPYGITGATNSPNDVSVTLDPTTGQMTATLSVASVKPPAGNPLNTAVYKFEPNTSTSAYIDYNYFGGVSIAGGGTTPASTVNGAPVVSTAQAIVSVPQSVAQAVVAGIGNIPGGAICQCDFTRWGMWSSDSVRSDGASTVTDIGHANLWVAGQLPNASDVPASGTAIYIGHVIAQVWNGTNQYLSGGAFGTSVNFATKTAAVAAELDGGVYAGTANLNVSNPVNFSGTLPIQNAASAHLPPTLNMQLDGSFFKGTASPVGEMGGSVFVSGRATSYVGSGIFAAKMQ